MCLCLDLKHKTCLTLLSNQCSKACILKHFRSQHLGNSNVQSITLSQEQGGNPEHIRFSITNYLPILSDREVCVLWCLSLATRTSLPRTHSECRWHPESPQYPPLTLKPRKHSISTSYQGHRSQQGKQMVLLTRSDSGLASTYSYKRCQRTTPPQVLCQRFP